MTKPVLIVDENTIALNLFLCCAQTAINTHASMNDLPLMELTPIFGKQYIKVTATFAENTSVFCYIASVDGENRTMGKFISGDIFIPKNAGSPMPGVRGNIYSGYHGVEALTKNGSSIRKMRDKGYLQE